MTLTVTFYLAERRMGFVKAGVKRAKNQKIVFSTQLCDNIHKFRRIIHKHWKPIQQDPFLRENFPDKPIIAHKTAPNLGKKLVRAKLKPLDPQELTNKTSYSIYLVSRYFVMLFSLFQVLLVYLLLINLVTLLYAIQGQGNAMLYVVMYTYIKFLH